MKITSQLTGLIAGTFASVFMLMNAYYIIVDMAHLTGINHKIIQMGPDGNKAQIEYYKGRELSHRINVFAEGTWFMLSAILLVNSMSLCAKLESNRKQFKD